MRRPPSGIPFFAVIFRMSFPAFSLMCSILPWVPNPDQKSLILLPVVFRVQGPRSVTWQSGIYLVDPAEDAARQVRRVGEPVLPEETDGAGAPTPGFAVDDNFVGGVELVEAAGELAERDVARPGDAADGELEWFAHVED